MPENFVTKFIFSNGFSIFFFVISILVIVFAIKNWKKDKWLSLLLIAVLVCFLFLCYPILLNEDAANTVADNYFTGLRYREYKGSFLESVGGMLGTFLAIVGALWTQHHFEQEQERKAEIETATIIFYDFKFAFREVHQKLNKCRNSDPAQENFDEKKIRDHFINYQILIDNKWIRNVSRLSNNFNTSDIEEIYYVYGLISSINQAIYAGIPDMKDFKDTLSLFYQLTVTNLFWEDTNDANYSSTKTIYEKLRNESKQRDKI